LAKDTVDSAVSWLRGACKAPAFAWIHLWDPHMPYAPPAPFDTAYYSGDPRAPEHDSFSRVELSWALYDMSHLRAYLRRHPRALRDVKRELGVGSREARRLALAPAKLHARAPGEDVYQRLFAELRPVLNELHRTLPLNRDLAGMLAGVRDLE